MYYKLDINLTNIYNKLNLQYMDLPEVAVSAAVSSNPESSELLLIRSLSSGLYSSLSERAPSGSS